MFLHLPKMQRHHRRDNLQSTEKEGTGRRYRKGVFKMNKFTIALVVCMLLMCVVTFYLGYNQAFEDIISNKCWLNKQSRDIECIKYIAK